MPNDTEVRCESKGKHTQHGGALRDYAYPGSVTRIVWADEDRRSFRGEWPGRCGDDPQHDGCTLPSGHHGNHAA